MDNEKYLDREDVEGLGWIYDPTTGSFKKGDSLLGLHNSRGIEIGKRIVIQKNNSSPVFAEPIKNKSELIKLMQKHNIE